MSNRPTFMALLAFRSFLTFELCIDTQNLGKIGWDTTGLLHIFDVPDGGRPPSWFITFCTFLLKVQLSPKSVSTCQIWPRSDDLGRVLVHFCFHASVFVLVTPLALRLVTPLLLSWWVVMPLSCAWDPHFAVLVTPLPLSLVTDVDRRTFISGYTVWIAQPEVWANKRLS